MGWHAWYLATGPLRARLCDGVDLKHHAGYVVAPPSLHPSGRRYAWGNALPIAHAPVWLTGMIRTPSTIRRTVQPGIGNTAADDALVRTVSNAKQGARNDVTYWAACRAAERGAPGELFDRIRSAAIVAGLTEREATLTIDSARATGQVAA